MSYTTNKSLLRKVAANDESSWRTFMNFYRSFIRLCGSDHCLTQEELDDLEQDVALCIYKDNLIERYQSSLGRFRSYLRTLIHRRAIDILRRRLPRHVVVDSEKLLESAFMVPEASAAETEQEHRWRETIMSMALAELRESVSSVSYTAFDLYARQGLDASQVASMLKLSVNQVYIAKNRVTAALAAIVSRLQQELQ